MSIEEVINILELRNYLLRPGMRSEFSNYFAEHLVQPQIDMGGYVLGQYRVKDAPDNFLWLRGFTSMETRSRFLPGFYGGTIWKQHRQNANNMMLNSDNVHLLKPLIWDGTSLAQGKGIRADQLKPEKGIAVIDYYIANTKIDKLIAFFGHVYIPLLRTTGVEQSTFWVSELTENDFPALPVLQDKNLLVAITFYKDEAEYQQKQTRLESHLTPELREEMLDLVTTQNRLIIYPDRLSVPLGRIFKNPETKSISLSLGQGGELEIQPSATSSQNDYDFLIGHHRVHHRKLKSRLSSSNEWIEFDGTKETIPILGGLGNVELHSMKMPDGSVKEGMALRLFNPVTRLWSLYWADSDFGILDKPQVGSFENNLGIFLARDTFQGKETIVQFQYDKTDPQNPTWGQAFSTDGGQTWEWNWFMFYEK